METASKRPHRSLSSSRRASALVIRCVPFVRAKRQPLPPRPGHLLSKLPNLNSSLPFSYVSLSTNRIKKNRLASSGRSTAVALFERNLRRSSPASTSYRRPCPASETALSDTFSSFQPKSSRDLPVRNSRPMKARERIRFLI